MVKFFNLNALEKNMKYSLLCNALVLAGLTSILAPSLSFAKERQEAICGTSRDGSANRVLYRVSDRTIRLEDPEREESVMLIQSSSSNKGLYESNGKDGEFISYYSNSSPPILIYGEDQHLYQCDKN